MERTSHTLWRILVGLVLVVVLVSAVVVTVSQYQRAERAETRATLAEGDRTLAEGNLTEVEITLAGVRADLALTRQRLTRTTSALNHRSDQAQALGARMHACRYLIRVNDHLLYSGVAQQRATGQLLKRSPNMRTVKQHLNQTARHTHAILVLVKRAGYRDISALVNACAPPRR